MKKSEKERAAQKNRTLLERKLKAENYTEIFLTMGKKYVVAIPDLSQCRIAVIFSSSGGPRPKAQALKEWLNRKESI